MKVGVFIPIGNNGWLLSQNAPQYKPSFALNKTITLKAPAGSYEFICTVEGHADAGMYGTLTVE